MVVFAANHLLSYPGTLTRHTACYFGCSSGLSCPSADFLEDSFLQAARNALKDEGVLIINLVSRAASHHKHTVSQLKRVSTLIVDIFKQLIEQLLLAAVEY
jgi:hypothetical protein